MRESRVQTVIWFQAASCTGCSISLMNADYPSIKNLLLDELVPGKALILRFHATLMGPTGQPALEVLGQARAKEAGNYLLVVEGAIPTAEGGRFGMVGDIPMAEQVHRLASHAAGVIALGTCAAYGGIPAGAPNPTSCVGVGEFLHGEGVEVPVINVPGCPPHPRWFVETLAQLLLNPSAMEQLDEVGRLRSVYAGLIHENCPRRADFVVGRFASSFGEPGCLLELGCKGPYTSSLCPAHRWNGGVNWCIEAGHPCLGCCEPEFPDFPAPLFRKVGSAEAAAAYRRSACAK